MSVVVSNCYQICNDPTNKSTAKQLFSFPKDARFKLRKPYCEQPAYEAYSDFSRPQKSKSPDTFGACRTQLFYSKERLSKPAPVEYTLPTAFSAVRKAQTAR